MRRLPRRAHTALVVAPHSDDEIIGCLGLLDRLAPGRSVRIVVVTDGAASHPGSIAWPRKRLISARMAESRRALRRLGFPAGSVRFLGLADGAVDPVRCRLALAREARRAGPLDLIVGPVADDAHQDHRTVADALSAIRSPARRVGYRVWPAVRHRDVRQAAIAVSAARKRSLVRLYRSQIGTIRDDPDGFAIAGHEMDAFCAPLERYRFLS